MTADDYLGHEKGEDTMLQEAMESLRQGNRSRARDLLTRLLKADQNNATYWIWLSAAVETKKERLYCLQTAYKLDPENPTARLGLVFSGGLSLDRSSMPVPQVHRRNWEKDLTIRKEMEEEPSPKASKDIRIAWFLGIAVIVISLIAAGVIVFTGTGIQSTSPTTFPLRPTFTMSQTPSLTPAFLSSTPTFLGPTPLSYFLPSEYTKTPRYVFTEHSPVTQSSYEAGLRFLESGQTDIARVQFELVLVSEPEAVDVLFYIGESYRMEGDFSGALDSYQAALNIEPGFAPAVLGRALTNLGRDPDYYIKSDLDQVIMLDPLYVEAYQQRALYHMNNDNFEDAIHDLEIVIELAPGSALAWSYLAEAQLEGGYVDSALDSASKANKLDLTLLPVYLTLGKAYTEIGQTEEAVAVLRTYTIYEPGDQTATLILGEGLNALQDYQAALELMNQYVDRNPSNGEGYVQRGLAYLGLNNPNLAETDFMKAIGYNAADFDAQLGLARSFFDQGKPREAYIRAETYAHPLARSDRTKAQIYYWEGLFLEAIDEPLSAEGARNCWNSLLALPANVMPAEWRTTASNHLGVALTATSSPRHTQTLSP